MDYKLICYTGNVYIIIEAVENNIEELKTNFIKWKEAGGYDFDLMFVIEDKPIIHNLTEES